MHAVVDNQENESKRLEAMLDARDKKKAETAKTELLQKEKHEKEEKEKQETLKLQQFKEN